MAKDIQLPVVSPAAAFSGGIVGESIAQLKGERKRKANLEELEYKRETDRQKRQSVFSEPMAELLSGYFKKHGMRDIESGVEYDTGALRTTIGSVAQEYKGEISAKARLDAAKLSMQKYKANQSQKSGAWRIQELGRTIRKDKDAYSFGILNEKDKRQFEENYKAYLAGLNTPVVGDIVKDIDLQLGFEPIVIAGIKTPFYKPSPTPDVTPSDSNESTYNDVKYTVGQTLKIGEKTYIITGFDAGTGEPELEEK